jgi:hypothetical protein
VYLYAHDITTGGEWAYLSTQGQVALSLNQPVSVLIS